MRQGSGHTSLPTSSGPGAASNGEDRPPPAPSRGAALRQTAHALRRDSGEDPQHRREEQGQSFEGGRKGPADPNPKNHHPDQPKYWVSSTGSKGRRGLEAPSLAPKACPLRPPSWPQARFFLVGQRP